MKIVTGGVTKPQGFKSNGIASGIKRSGKLDLGLITSDVPAVSAAVFTKNSIKAAPLIVSQKNLKNSRAQAIVVNSGNANCFTGQFGLLYAEQTTEVIGNLLGIPKDDVIVASTGIIGRMLPFEKIKNSAKTLVKGLSRQGGSKTAKAILTTDLRTKECAVQIKLGSKTVTIAGCAKGSGMIAPNMATMLGFITTDAAISPKMLKLALKTVTDETFNSITIDGCMSTNDMVVVMANGLAKNKMITTEGRDFKDFCKGLYEVSRDLAKKIVLDGEGATKFIEIHVLGAKTQAQARQIGLAIANSNLVKTAVAGSNPNWGRVAAAVGSVGITNITEKSLRIKFSSFKKKHVLITIQLNLGKAQAIVYTSDLTYEYVKINMEYN